MLMASSSSDVVVVIAGNCSPPFHVTFGCPLGLGKTYGDSVLVTDTLIIHMLNTFACVAVNEMVRLLFEYYGNVQGRSHFLSTTIKM